MYDIIIIGSGSAGLTAAIYASRANLQALVVEKDAMGSGQIAVTEQVDNYPGLLHIGGYELGEKFREHAEVLGFDKLMDVIHFLHTMEYVLSRTVLHFHVPDRSYLRYRHTKRHSY